MMPNLNCPLYLNFGAKLNLGRRIINRKCSFKELSLGFFLAELNQNVQNWFSSWTRVPLKTPKYSYEILASFFLKAWSQLWEKQIFFSPRNGRVVRSLRCVFVYVGEGMNDSFSSTYHAYKWNRTVWSILCLASFTQEDVSKSHPGCYVLFRCQVSFALFCFPSPFSQDYWGIISTVKFTLLGLQFFCFDKCGQLCHHHHNQDRDYFYLPRKCSFDNLFCLWPVVLSQWKVMGLGEGEELVKLNLTWLP